MKTRLCMYLMLCLFCRCTARNLWDLWWLGNPRERYAPYRQIDQADLAEPKDHNFLSKGRYVVDALVKFCPGAPSTNELSKKNCRELETLFASAYCTMCSIIYPGTSVEVLDKRRVGDRSYVTVYDHLKKCGL